MLICSKIEPVQAIVIPSKKAPEGANFENGADDVTWLRPLATIILDGLTKMSINEISSLT